jgi:hypothetical protein
LNGALAWQDAAEEKLQHFDVAAFGEFNAFAHERLRVPLNQRCRDNRCLIF